jgi:hypothetical protein
MTCALTFVVLSAAAYAQTPPPAQPPAQPPAAAPPKLALSFTTDAGLLLVQIKKDQVSAFEEMISKIRAGVAKSTDEALKKQLAGWKVFKSAEDMQGNALYVIVADPATKDTEYELFGLLQKVMTPEELRSEETQAFFKRAQAAFAAPYNKLNLSPVGGGM